jgi:DNA mismatch repair protein MutS2
VYEVASNIGLNKKLIKRAKQLTDTKQYDLDVLLAEVQTQQEKLKTEQEELNRKSAQANLVENEYRKLRDELYKQRNDIILQSKEEAKGILKDANKEIERTIREIKETKANKKKTQEVRKELADKIVENEPEELAIPIVSDLNVGDTVQLLNSSTTGEIIEIKRDKATLSVGGIITKTKLVNLEKVGKKTAKKIKKYISESSYVDKQTSFKSEKDIRGMRTYDALAEIDTWVDSAIILGVNKLRVLHGKGNGILKAEIRRHLKGNPAIAKIAYERVDLGGEGISIIELK